MVGLAPLPQSQQDAQDAHDNKPLTPFNSSGDGNVS
eukprot:CAMPEP_0198117692 /NCGR_PEP_ID=MMETSP1442-20131203/18997_1 /TAXON_ID= /ORGANISM="Craspedostauros australis, Strain CCMP3328" /LENGTH=35 /DNA_ID= /DNA_START= /DNA_END= /DNA_ORIENTATION=